MQKGEEADAPGRHPLTRRPGDRRRPPTPAAEGRRWERRMGWITTAEGTKLYYKDWGTGRPVVFSHGWPLDDDAWDDQAFLVASNGFRAVAHDRRGHGRSEQPWNGNDMDTYADDLASVMDALDLRDAIL